MKESTITFENLNIEPTVYFLGTDEEIEEAERKEAQRAEDIKRVVLSPDFIALEYYTEKGARRILHHSTRKGVLFQLSYIDADGIPSMHENYIRTGKDAVNQSIGSLDDLTRHFINQTLRKNITTHILTA